MRMKIIAVFTGLAVAALLSGAVLAAPDDHGKAAFKRAYQFHGTVVDAGGEAGTDTAGQFVMSVTKANGNGKRYLASTPGDVTLSLSDTTRFYGDAGDAADLAVGDVVKVKARNSETGLIAQKVKVKAVTEEEPEPTPTPTP